MLSAQSSPVRLFSTPWTITHQAPLSVEFSRQDYWSGLPCSPPGNLPDPGIEPTSLVFRALAGVFFTTSATWEALEGKEGRGEMLQLAGWHGSSRQGSEVGAGRLGTSKAHRAHGWGWGKELPGI